MMQIKRHWKALRFSFLRHPTTKLLAKLNNFKGNLQNYTGYSKAWNKSSPPPIFNVDISILADRWFVNFETSTFKLGEGGVGYIEGIRLHFFGLLNRPWKNVLVKVLPTYFVVGCLRNTFCRNCLCVVFLASFSQKADSAGDNRTILDNSPISAIIMVPLYDVTVTITCQNGKCIKNVQKLLNSVYFGTFSVCKWKN